MSIPMAIGGIGSGNTSYATAQAAPRTQAPQLSPEALAQIQKLKARDTEVRQHEQAHLAAAGALALSGASYTYQRGPDGVNYAIGGEVQIDTSPGATPAETLARARAISAAALAPADPSGADRGVAAQAQQMAATARAELAAQAGDGGRDTAQQRALQRAYGGAPAAAPALDVYA
ncbi:putative metalloprotease CJM1_0395 family protein [Janthinobacterium fluminis]|uniref:Metalloprotease CJM1_0395 family protein n=1 Tax=Janthinobacterium fluminis TaxID=2987524 RepID=A0ABT5K0I0_9BURK|nr:putative metalloprotease CJM1_0395 family protein [Janthinobacterium fluminis]MDC8758483.1 putative metalloprotease CJM1_0395 family protein [Janthinobacterium fluminis]